METSGNQRNDGLNETTRIEMFSDGVFAIAITLLVIEIGVPHLENEPEGTTLLGALIRQWPSYLGYVISVLVIGTVWANHHNRFTYIVRSDHVLLFLNTVFLMCVAFIPFPTALLAEYTQSEERTTAVAVYTGALTITAVFFTILWVYAANDRRLVDRNLNPATLQAMTRRYVAGMSLYLVAFALTFVSVVLSLALIFVLALLFVLPEPGGSGNPEDDRTEAQPDKT